MQGKRGRGGIGEWKEKVYCSWGEDRGGGVEAGRGVKLSGVYTHAGN